MHEAMLSCVAMPVQLAGLEAVTGPQDAVAAMREAYRDRRDTVLERLRAAGVPAFRPRGAFYVWIDISAARMPSRDFAFALVDEYGTAVAPGSAFGVTGDSYVRVSLAAAKEDLLEGVDRLARLLDHSSSLEMR
jgi:aspartate aminotransferase